MHSFETLKKKKEVKFDFFELKPFSVKNHLNVKIFNKMVLETVSSEFTIDVGNYIILINSLIFFPFSLSKYICLYTKKNIYQSH